MEKLPHIGTILPNAWINIRQKLENLNKPYISHQEYVYICAEFGLDSKQADFLSGYYHNLGVFLHFQDNPILKEIVFLKPEWATEAVYQVVENLGVQKKNGRFKYERLGQILDSKKYPTEIHHKLLELMKKFELCFELEGKNEYVMPELLKGDRPVFEWDYNDNLAFVYHYTFMPAGIATRFIVRVCSLHKDELYWKNGVVLNWEGHTEAMITCEALNKKIQIRLKGQDKKGLLAIIRHHIENIHETLNWPKVDQMLPCTCKDCQKSEEPYFHKYQDLLVVQQKGKDARCNKSAEDISVGKLLGEYGIEEKNKFERDLKLQGKTAGSNYFAPEGKIEDTVIPPPQINKEPWYTITMAHKIIAIIAGIIAIFVFITGIKSCKDVPVKKSSLSTISQPNTSLATPQRVASQPNHP